MLLIGALVVGFVAGLGLGVVIMSALTRRDVVRIRRHAEEMHRELEHRRCAQMSGAYPVQDPQRN